MVELCGSSLERSKVLTRAARWLSLLERSKVLTRAARWLSLLERSEVFDPCSPSVVTVGAQRGVYLCCSHQLVFPTAKLI